MDKCMPPVSLRATYNRRSHQKQRQNRAVLELIKKLEKKA